MKSQQDFYMERRSGNERRNWHCEYDFPYVDTHGMLVVSDRRKSDERRSMPLVATASSVVY